MQVGRYHMQNDTSVHRGVKLTLNRCQATCNACNAWIILKSLYVWWLTPQFYVGANHLWKQFLEQISLFLICLVVAISLTQTRGEAIGKSSLIHALLVFVACMCFWMILKLNCR